MNDDEEEDRYEEESETMRDLLINIGNLDRHIGDEWNMDFVDLFGA